MSLTKRLYEEDVIESEELAEEELDIIIEWQ